MKRDLLLVVAAAAGLVVMMIWLGFFSPRCGPGDPGSSTIEVCQW